MRASRCRLRRIRPVGIGGESPANDSPSWKSRVKGRKEAPLRPVPRRRGAPGYKISNFIPPPPSGGRFPDSCRYRLSSGFLASPADSPVRTARLGAFSHPPLRLLFPILIALTRMMDGATSLSSRSHGNPIRFDSRAVPPRHPSFHVSANERARARARTEAGFLRIRAIIPAGIRRGISRQVHTRLAHACAYAPSRVTSHLAISAGGGRRRGREERKGE